MNYRATLVSNALATLQDGKGADGKPKVRLEGPAVLDEGAIQLEEKRNLWPFTQIEPGGGKFQRGTE